MLDYQMQRTASLLRQGKTVARHAGVRFLLLLLCAVTALAMALAPSGAAFADDGAAPSAEAPGAGAAGAAGDSRSLPTSVQDALAQCVAGVFAGWGATDPASFYDTDMLLIDDGSCVWMAFDVYRAGASEGSDAFLKRLEQYVGESYAGDQRGLDAYSPTTWARTAIVSGTMGANPHAFGTNGQGQPADLLSDGLYNWAYTDDLADQGSNALIYCLQAVDALQVAVPADAAYSAQDMLDGLLACQSEDGSFALSPGSRTGSVDLTGMALAALAPFRDIQEVAQAIEDAAAYLSAQQSADGGFAAEGEATSESCAMAIVGLSACGIDVALDDRFVKQGGTPLDALLKFQKADGTFAHLMGDLSDESMRDLPTEQALRALVAYVELQQGGDGNVYTNDMQLDVWKVRSDEGAGPVGGEEEGVGLFSDTGWVPYLISIGVGAALGIVAVMAIWLVGRMRRKARR